MRLSPGGPPSRVQRLAVRMFNRRHRRGRPQALGWVGLGGLLVRAISERRRELAILAAIGASPADGGRTILREGTLLAEIGLAIGVAGAAVAATLLESFLYGVKPLDPVTFVGVAVFVSAAALATSFLAAWLAN